MCQRLMNFLVRWGTKGLLLGLAGCVEPYMPDIINAPNRFLVVDGFINGNGVTRIKLTRTINISTTTSSPVETKATLYIVDDLGVRYALQESIAGSYQSDSLTLNTTRKYQLRIMTNGASATSYESELVPLKVTPTINQLTWRTDGEQVQVQVSTQDATGQSRYYRWGAAETWEFTSAFHSALEYRDGIIKNRVTPIYTCWHTERNTSIKQASSASLSYDALTDFSILTFPVRSERFKIRYSVLVSQYAETVEEFTYYELLRKNTEAVGTVNDPLPTQLTGNVHCLSNAAEPVLGFVGAHTVQQKRLFISRQDLPSRPDSDFDTPYQACYASRELFRNRPDSSFEYYYPNTRIFNNPKSVPLSLIIYPIADDPLATPIIQGYLGSSVECVDCRTRGSNTKPSFW
jgi:hypothetical protein